MGKRIDLTRLTLTINRRRGRNSIKPFRRRGPTASADDCLKAELRAMRHDQGAAATVCSVIEQAVGEALAGKITSVRTSRGVLTVCIPDSSARYEIDLVLRANQRQLCRECRARRIRTTGQ